MMFVANNLNVMDITIVYTNITFIYLLHQGYIWYEQFIMGLDKIILF